jgi:hypothetical protein
MAPTVTSPAAPFDAQVFFGTTTTGPNSGSPSILTGTAWNRSDVTLTSAQILALLTVPIALVPAPGVGYWVNPLYFILRYIGGSVAYTDAGGAVSIGNASGATTLALASNAIFLVTVSPNTRKQYVSYNLGVVGTGFTDTAANPPLSDNAALSISKATNNFAAGNGTMHITTYYTIETTV